MYKFGLKLWSVNTDFYFKEAKRLYEMGVYDYIELYIVPGSTETLPKWQSLNVPFNLHCPHFAHGFNLSDPSLEAHNKKIFDEVRAFADGLKAQFIVVHGGIDGDIEQTAKQFKALNDKRAIIENKPLDPLPNNIGAKRCVGYSPEQIAFVKSETDCGFCLDFGHAVCAANSQNIEPYSYIDEFLALNPDMYHLTDINDMSSPYDAHPHISKGKLDIKRLLNLIPQGKNITIETEKNSKESLNDFIEDIKCLKTMCI